MENEKNQILGHVVIQVNDLDKSTAFYEKALRLRTTEIARFEGRPRAFLSGSEIHHEIVLNQRAGGGSYIPVGERVLEQLAFEVKSHDLLVDYYNHLNSLNIPVELKDNQISWSIYFYDPDSINIEIFWDIRKEPFGKSLWEGNQQDLSEEKFLNPKK